jgi:hypothetical protein
VRRFPLSIFFLIVLLATAALGQSPNGTISGLVSDGSGRSITAAGVVAVNELTGVQYERKTNDEGIYVLSSLPPGPYRLQVSKIGFKTLIKPDIVLNVQDALAINFTLPVGALSETITVQGGTSLVNTESAEVGAVVDRNFAENLPMNGRSFQSLITLTPGVVVTASTGYDAGQFSVNGQRASSNYWMVDGVSANVGMSTNFGGNGFAGALGSSGVLGNTNGLVSIDAMQEFRIQTSTYAPEFGRTPGGQISIATRSGTNLIHGTVFDYLRNDVFDASDWFNGFTNRPPIPKAEERQNDFGGTFSGPILADRTFFFISYEGFRLRLPRTALTTVPSISARQAAIPTMSPYLDAFPLPNGPDLGNGIADFNVSYSNASSLDAYSLRIDHRLNKSLNLFGRYSYSPSEIIQRGPFGDALSEVEPAKVKIQTTTIGAISLLSPNTMDDLRINYSRTDASSYSYLDNFGRAVPLPSLPLPAPYTAKNANLLFSVFSLSGGYETGARVRNVQRQMNVVNSLSLQKGSHSIKFGVDFRHLSPIYGPALYSQSPAFDDVASAQNGVLNSSFIQSNLGVGPLFNNLGVFAQDTWHVLPRVTLTYGLRWDVDFSPGSATGPAFPSVTGFSVNDLTRLALAPTGTPPFKTRYGSVAPRLGVAYQILQSQDWGSVLRGGLGIFYDLATSEIGNLIFQAAYPFEAAKFNPGGSFPLDPASAAAPSIIPPGSGSGELLAINPGLQMPYTLEWNMAVEQSIGRQQAVSVSYLGAVGRRLIQSAFLFSPPNYAEAVLVGNTANSNYSALQTKFQRRLSHGLQILASYTWGHSIDDASAGSVGNAANTAVPNIDPSVNRGPSDFDIRQAFSAGITYEIPGPRLKVLAALLHGWSADSIIQARSAVPVNVFDGSFFKLNTGFTQVRPDRVPSQSPYLSGAQYPGGRALNPAAFISPPSDPTTGDPLRQGDVGRNALRGFGATQWDLGVHRDFPIHDSVKLQVRAEMFNILNHPNFAGPVGDINNSQFGLSNSMLGQSLGGGNVGGGGFSPLYQIGGPRSVQFGLKLMF